MKIQIDIEDPSPKQMEAVLYLLQQAKIHRKDLVLEDSGVFAGELIVWPNDELGDPRYITRKGRIDHCIPSNDALHRDSQPLINEPKG